jgi:hypothetical protein
MKSYAAEVSTGTVSQVIVGDFVWANENLSGVWVDCTCGDNPCAAPGYTYDATTEDFVAPVAPEVPEP